LCCCVVAPTRKNNGENKGRKQKSVVFQKMTTQNQTFEHDTSKQIENNNYTSDGMFNEIIIARNEFYFFFAISTQNKFLYFLKAEEDSDIEPEKQGYVLLSDSMNENTNVVSDNQVNNHEELHQYPHLDDNFDDNEVRNLEVFLTKFECENYIVLLLQCISKQIKIKNKKGNKDESLAKSAIEKFDRNYITEVENAIKECKTPQKSEPIPSGSQKIFQRNSILNVVSILTNV
jgi:hypothetical protein